ncbi:MAG TPA: MiaB/RimO family radical SAM methylthiotransferase [Terracidiphilus sp.]|nr:MiaB/RimO family radical SAM methylthiotransferase [Terracidiphilus sp.]
MTKIAEKSAPAQAPVVGFVSLGCPKNLVDSEVMMGLLDRAGARLTARPEEAEILVVNTCSFIDTAKQESVDTILEMVRHKTQGRARKLIVAGCLVERYRDEIQKSIPEVDAVVGTGELESILQAAGIAPVPSAPSPFTILTSVHAEMRPGQESQAGTHKHASQQLPSQHVPSQQLPSVKGTGFSPYIGGTESNGALAPAVSPAFRPEGDHRERQGRFSRVDWQGAAHLLPTYLYDESTPRLLFTPRASAYVKIAEGCDHPCTFCVIPNLRGKFRSRRFESVVAETQRLVAGGVREITLIGQDTTCYGEDLGLKDGLATLLDTLARIEGLRWLRFLYAYPNRITGRLLETIARHDNICKYLDVPLQHASADVLKRMKRGAGAEIFLKTIEKVRAVVPGIALRTSFIVGFPGESLRDFEVLEQFIGEARFDWLGVFTYSHEEGSQAFALDGQVPRRTIEARKRRLMKLQQSISKRAKQQWIGRQVTLLAEGPSEETDLLWEGRTQYHAPEIDGKVFINDFGDLDGLEAGRFYTAEITEAHQYDLVARIVAPL